MCSSKIYSILSIAITIALIAGSADAQVNILPKPQSMTVGSGTFTVPSTVIIYADAESDSTVPWIIKLFEQAGFTAQLGPSSSAQVVVSKDGSLSAQGPEGYELTVTGDKITIASSTLQGQFYGIQTLRQLFPPEIERSPDKVPKPVNLQQVEITDKPRFGYRGCMFDVARHFFPMSYLKLHVDRMALYKLNMFHLHLTDDQGWRLVSNEFPELTNIGGKTQVGGAQGNFYYTQAEMKELIEYAANRNVTIVPEFDMPGHTGAMFVSLPGLAGCSSPDLANGSMYTGIQTYWSALCVGGIGTQEQNQYTTEVVNTLLEEMFPLFPSEYINIGGDEAEPVNGEPFNIFIREMETLFSSHGKKMIGWEEIGVPRQLSSTWTLAWNHTGAGDINSNCDYQFIDHPNKSGLDNGMTWCTDEVTLQNVYSTPMNSSHEGVECCLWSEYVTNAAEADNKFFPRTAATAEVGWASSNNNWSEFRSRIQTHGERFDAMGISWFSQDGSWDRGDTYPTASSVYQDFIPEIIPTSITSPGYVRREKAKQTLQGTMYDIRGRVIGCVHGKNINIKNAAHSPAYGIYFLMTEKNDTKRKSQLKIFLDE